MMKTIVYQPPCRYAGAEDKRGDALPGLQELLQRGDCQVVQAPETGAMQASADLLAGDWTCGAEVWITLRLCPHAPDAWGPRICQQLEIPYVLWEPFVGPGAAELATVEEKEQAKSALRLADLIVTTCSFTAQGLATLLDDPHRLIRIPPFADLSPCLSASHLADTARTALAARYGFSPNATCLVTDGPQEPEAADEDWRLLVQTLSRIVTLDWRLIVLVEDAPSASVQQAVSQLPRERLVFCRVSGPDERARLLAASDLYVWPACQHSTWPTLLDAQACGTPVVACASDAVADRVLDGQTGRLTANNAEALANAISFLVRQPTFLASFSTQAREIAATRHERTVAADTLRRLLREVVSPAAS